MVEWKNKKEELIKELSTRKCFSDFEKNIILDRVMELE